MMKKMLFIYNPNAGTGTLKPKLSDVLDIFTKAGYEVTVYPTQKYHDGADKMESCPDGYDLIVCLSAIYRQVRPMISPPAWESRKIFWLLRIQR